MAIKKLRTHEEVAARILAEKVYRNFKAVEVDLEKISESVTDSLNLLKTFQKNVETSAKSSLVIDVDRPTPKNSPLGKKDKNVQVVKDLEKNFTVIQSLYDAKAALETLEAKLKASGTTMGADASTALTGVAAVRKQVFKGLDQAFAFLNGLASKTMPDEFGAFVDKMRLLVSRTIAFTNESTYSYMFVSKESNLCYCSYIQLKDVIDDKGARLPELYVVVSMEVSSKSLGTNGYFLDVLYEFEPPSESLLTSKINPLKMASVANEMADLLNVSHFANSIQRIPVGLLVKPGSLEPDLFSYSEHIKAIEVDSGTNQINFWLKPTVQDKALVDKILKQLYLDFKGMIAATRASLRPAITDKKDKSGSKCQVISFFFTRGSNAPAAGVEDVEFLKERFNLNDATVTKILQTINKD